MVHKKSKSFTLLPSFGKTLFFRPCNAALQLKRKDLSKKNKVQKCSLQNKMVDVFHSQEHGTIPAE